MKIIDSIGKDKILHDDVCFTAALIVACVAKLAGCCKDTTMVVAWFVVFAIAIGKELYDEKKYKGASESDWLADVIGLVRAELVILLLM